MLRATRGSWLVRGASSSLRRRGRDDGLGRQLGCGRDVCGDLLASAGIEKVTGTGLVCRLLPGIRHFCGSHFLCGQPVMADFRLLRTVRRLVARQHCPVAGEQEDRRQALQPDSVGLNNHGQH